VEAFFPYSATTGRITVRVNPRFLPDQSDAAAGRFVWSYHVRIENDDAAPVQLIARHWVITDADGDTDEVRGEGVVGAQPVIVPAGSFDYVSGCPLPTARGSMRGSYAMLGSDGLFEVTIPRFQLESRHVRPDVRE